MVAGEYLVFPTVALFLIVLGVMKASPRPKDWSRVVVVTIFTVSHHSLFTMAIGFYT